MLEELNDESFQNVDLKPYEDNFNDFEENENHYKEEINYNKNNIVEIIPMTLETSKVISNNNSEVRKEELKTEQNKDNNTIDFAKKLVENGDIEKAINFVESERDKDRKCQTINKVCDTVVTISRIASYGHLISELCKNKNNSNN